MRSAHSFAIFSGALLGVSSSPTFSIKLSDTNLCLDLPHGDATNGNQLWIYECNGSVSQQWVRMNPTGDDAKDQRVHWAGDYSKCLDVPGGYDSGKGKNGNMLQIWDCKDPEPDGQEFFFDKGDTMIDNGIIDGKGFCWDVHDGAGSGALLQTWKCGDKTKTQQWFVTKVKDANAQIAV